MVIVVRDIVNSCDTNAQGAVVFDVVLSHLTQGHSVTLDFSGVFNVTTSFVNTAFVDLLDHLNFDDVKSGLILTSTNRQVGKLIKDRMQQTVQSERAAA